MTSCVQVTRFANFLLQLQVNIFYRRLLQSHLFYLFIIPSTRNRVGGDIVTLPFVGGWVSEWVDGWVGECVRGWVRGSVTLYLVDTIATTVFAQSISNFTCTFAMMRGGTLLILGHGFKGQGQPWHSVYKTLWTR